MSNAGGSFDIYSKPADSSAGASLVLEDPYLVVPGSLSTDGRLLYHRVVEETQRDLWVLSADGTSSPFLESEFNEMVPRLHPNGRWVAYVSDLSGEDRVYLQPFPDGGRVVLVSAGSGTEPVWSRDGRELFYRDGSRMMAVAVDPDNEISIGGARVVFEGHYALDPLAVGIPNYDVSADGERFLMIREGEDGNPEDADAEAAPTHATLIVVENWFEELKRLVPTN